MTRVLVVEDDPAAMRLAATALELEGFGVIQAMNGLAGLVMACKESPDIVVLDVMLPGMDGYEVCQAIRAETAPVSSVPIIMVSAKAQEDDAATGMKVGATSYVRKPVSPRELARAVREALAAKEGQPA